MFRKIGESPMDDASNRFGRLLGDIAKDLEDCQRLCEGLADRGHLETYSPNTTLGYHG